MICTKKMIKTLSLEFNLKIPKRSTNLAIAIDSYLAQTIQETNTNPKQKKSQKNNPQILTHNKFHLTPETRISKNMILNQANWFVTGNFANVRKRKIEKIAAKSPLIQGMAKKNPVKGKTQKMISNPMKKNSPRKIQNYHKTMTAWYKR